MPVECGSGDNEQAQQHLQRAQQHSGSRAGGSDRTDVGGGAAFALPRLVAAQLHIAQAAQVNADRISSATTLSLCKSYGLLPRLTAVELHVAQAAQVNADCHSPIVLVSLSRAGSCLERVHHLLQSLVTWLDVEYGLQIHVQAASSGDDSAAAAAASQARRHAKAALAGGELPAARLLAARAEALGGARSRCSLIRPSGNIPKVGQTLSSVGVVHGSQRHVVKQHCKTVGHSTHDKCIAGKSGCEPTWQPLHGLFKSQRAAGAAAGARLLPDKQSLPQRPLQLAATWEP